MYLKKEKLMINCHYRAVPDSSTFHAEQNRSKKSRYSVCSSLLNATDGFPNGTFCFFVFFLGPIASMFSFILTMVLGCNSFTQLTNTLLTSVTYKFVVL